MAKTKIQAGQTFDTLTQPELHETLTKAMISWRQELARGDIYRDFAAQGVVAGDGTLRIGGSDSAVAGGSLGPRPGMLWAVNRVAITNALGTPVLRWYRNANDAATFIRGNMTVVAGDGYFNFGGNELVLNSEDVLLVIGTGLTAATVVTVTGQAREVPATMGWRLGGS